VVEDVEAAAVENDIAGAGALLESLSPADDLDVDPAAEGNEKDVNLLSPREVEGADVDDDAAAAPKDTLLPVADGWVKPNEGAVNIGVEFAAVALEEVVVVVDDVPDKLAPKDTPPPLPPAECPNPAADDDEVPKVLPVLLRPLVDAAGGALKAIPAALAVADADVPANSKIQSYNRWHET